MRQRAKTYWIWCKQNRKFLKNCNHLTLTGETSVLWKVAEAAVLVNTHQLLVTKVLKMDKFRRWQLIGKRSGKEVIFNEHQLWLFWGSILRIRLTGTIKQTKEKTKALTQTCYGKITSNTQVGHMKVRFAASQTLKIKPRDRQKIYLTLLSTSVILKLL